MHVGKIRTLKRLQIHLIPRTRFWSYLCFHLVCFKLTKHSWIETLYCVYNIRNTNGCNLCRRKLKKNKCLFHKTEITTWKRHTVFTKLENIPKTMGEKCNIQVSATLLQWRWIHERIHSNWHGTLTIHNKNQIEMAQMCPIPNSKSSSCPSKYRFIPAWAS